MAITAIFTVYALFPVTTSSKRVFKSLEWENERVHCNRKEIVPVLYSASDS